MIPGKGVHDPGHTAGGTWRTISVSLSTESLATWIAEIKRLYETGKKVIVRVNHGYGPALPTVPAPSGYDAFVYQLETWVSTLSPYVHAWQIGNEINLKLEWGGGQKIEIADYTMLFHRCRNSIKAIQSDAVVMPAAVSPGVPQWQDYWAAMVNSIECDGYSLHCYSSDYSKESVWHGPAWLTYREMLSVIPENKRHLPVYITEANGGLWKYYRAGWLSAVMGDLEWWNNKPETQKIHAITFYAYDERGHGYGMSPFSTVMEEYERLEEGTAMTEIRLPIISKPPSPEPVSPPDDEDREWDSVLNVLGVKLTEAVVPPGKEYWKLVSAKWQDAEASGGRHHIYVYPNDLSMRASWPGEFKTFTGDFPMFNAGNAYRVEPNTAMPHDAVEGLGLGTPDQPRHKIHTSFVLKWAKRIATGESPELRPILSLVHPVADPRYRRVTQKFGVNAQNYAQFGLAGHPGTDWGVPVGSIVRACADGMVIEAGERGPNGKLIRIDHGWGETAYLHLNDFDVNVGQSVKAGQTIARSGNTGNSTGPHLDVMLRIKPWDAENGFNGYQDISPFLSDESSSQIAYVIVTNGANIRVTPIGGEIITAVPYGERVSIVVSNDTSGWIRVKYKEYEGWMHPTLVGPTAPAPFAPITPEPAPADDVAVFDRCLAFTRKWEGGWADDPNDPGGSTMSGVTLGTYTRWQQEHGQPTPTKEDLRNIPDSVVRQIFYEWYWGPSGAAQLPFPMSLIHFDTAVLHGAGAAKGFLGNSGGDMDVYLALRMLSYVQMSHWKNFGIAWGNRVNDLMKEAYK